MRRYYITDRHGCSDLLACVDRAVRDSVDYIQIREKDLNARDLLALTRRVVALAVGSRTQILVNGRPDVAMAAGAHGVHLPSDAIGAEEWRTVLPKEFLIGVSCHSVGDLQRSRAADFAVFGSVFPSPGKAATVGLEALRVAVRVSPIPVFALGGVDEGNAEQCVAAGAIGIAGIRMFQR